MDLRKFRSQQARVEVARRKLARLMPYEEWCAAVNPTETAKELYAFVRRTLEEELEVSSRNTLVPPSRHAAGNRRARNRGPSVRAR